MHKAFQQIAASIAGLWITALLLGSGAHAASLSVTGPLTHNGSSSNCTYSSMSEDASGNWTVACGTGTKSITINATPPATLSCVPACTSYSSMASDALGNWTVNGCVPAGGGGSATMTQPAGTHNMYAGSALMLRATATGCGGAAVTKVEFFANDVLIPGATDETEPFEFNWSPSIGTYAVKAVATTGGTGYSSSTVTVNVSSSTPNVALVTPQPGVSPPAIFSFGSPLTLSATAAAIPERTISSVVFFAKRPSDPAPVQVASGTLNGGQWSATWTPAVTDHYFITAKATDSQVGTNTTPEVEIIVRDSGVSPTITLEADPTTLYSIATVTFTLRPSIGQGSSLGRAELWIAQNGGGYSKVATFTPPAASPFTHPWNHPPRGTHQAYAVVFDDLGRSAQSSPPLTITVQNVPPAMVDLGMLSHSHGGFSGGPIPLSVFAVDDDGDSLTVKFFNADTGTLLGNGVQNGDTFTYPWTPTAETEGVFRIRAEGSDGQSQSNVFFAVPVMRRPAADVAIPPGKTTSSVGAMAATFAVSEGGASTYSIPIPVPPGPAGMQPALSFNYSSQGGNGPLGLGWSIGGVSAITRCPSTVASNGARNGINYDDEPENDYFCLDGQRLIVAVARYPMPNPQQCGSNVLTTYATEYRTEIESYSKIVAYEDDPCIVIGPSRFEVQTKSGHWLLFGRAGRSHPVTLNEFGDGDNGTWVLSWPTSVKQSDRLNTVKIWPLSRAMDRAGNLIRYEYCGTNLLPDDKPACEEPPPPNGFPFVQADAVGAFPPTEHHLKAVYYAGRANRANRWVEISPVARIYVGYGTRNPDQQRAFDSGGGETTLTKVVHSITTGIHNGSAWEAVQAFFPWYDASLATARYRLRSVKQCAGGLLANGNPAGVCLQAAPGEDLNQGSTKFRYLEGATGDFGPGYAVTGGNRDDINAAGDLDGDGRTDLIYVPDDSDGVRVALSSGNFVWVDRTLPIYVSRGSDRYLADFNGDGKADLLLKTGGKYVFCDLKLPVSGSGPVVCTTPQVNTAFGDFYLQGDFNGDGRLDFLLYRGGANWDLHLGHATSGLTPTAIPVNYLPPPSVSANQLQMQYAVGDFNGDGRADILFKQLPQTCNLPPQEQDPVTCPPPVVTWNVFFSRPGPMTVHFQDAGSVVAGNGLLEKSVTHDFNGDGLADLAYPSNPQSPTTSWNICLSAGDGSFQRPDATATLENGAYTTKSLCRTTFAVKADVAEVVFGDFDGDGKTDMARHETGATWKICLARTATLGTLANHVTFECQNRGGLFDDHGSVVGNVLVGDFNGDGKTDLIGHHAAGDFQMALAPVGTPDLLDRITNGLGAETAITYAPLTDSSVYAVGGVTASADEVVIQSPLYVVKVTQESNGVKDSAGVIGFFNHSYQYTGLKGSTNGRGLLGFATRTVTDSNGLRKVTTYNQDVSTWWKAGRPDRTRTIYFTGSPSVVLSDAKNEWQLTSSTGGIFAVQLAKTVEAKVDLDQSSFGCSRMALYDPALTSVAQVDGFGNALFTLTDTGSCNIDNGAFASDNHQKRTTNTYLGPDNARWIIGRLSRAEVEHKMPGAPSVVRKSAFTYQGMVAATCIGAPDGHLCSETIEPDDSPAGGLRHSTAYEYDSWGNVVKTVQRFTAPGPYSTGEETRSSSIVFESHGRFPHTITNALNHKEERTYHPGHGALASVKGFLDDTRYIQTINTIDGFGRKVGETVKASDGARIAETDVTWAPDSSVANAVYSVTTTSHAKAQTKVYFDTLQREVARDVRAFAANQHSSTTTTYDTFGRKASIIRPVGSGTVTTTFAYDELGRTTAESASGTNVSLTTFTAYHGLSAVVRRGNDASGQKAITLRNSQGQIVSVSECLGEGVQNDSASCQGSRTAVTTTYGYDATGNAVSVRTPPTPAAPGGLLRTAGFDKRGRKLWSVDPDIGRSDFTYSGANELLSHRYEQNAGSPIVVNFVYDELGRLIMREDGGTFSDWLYDECFGRRRDGGLCYVHSGDGNDVIAKEIFLDEYGRAYRTRIEMGAPQINSRDDTHTLTDPQGRLSQIVHSTLHGVKYEYTAWAGDLQSIKDVRDNSIYWGATSRYPDGQIQAMNVGPTPITKTYDGFGRPATIVAGGGTLQNASYSFDRLGNLLSRVDPANILASQTFVYDTLNRAVSGGGMTVEYDDAGNITKRDGNIYTYVGATNRVQSTHRGTYSYDLVGNATTSAGRTITWKAFNMPASITNGAQTLSWAYDADHQRTKEVSSVTGTTTYFPGMERTAAPDGSIRYRHYISSPEGTVAALDVVESGGNTTIDRRYWLRDHLGSVVATINAATGQKTSMGYTVWGERSPAVPLTSDSTQQGFTGHEMLDEVGLVHMNGRVYDPAIGKFLSADPIVEAPFSGQSFNRYSYVMNNPLSATDPTGYSSWWVQWRRPVAAIAAAVAMQFYVMPALLTSPSAFAGWAGSSGLVYTTDPGIFLTTAGEAVSAVAAGFAAGGISGGNVGSALQGALFAGANFAIGSLTGVGNVVAHVVVGCAQQASAGGSCRGGALSGGFSAAAASVWSTQSFTEGLARTVVIGAVASRLSGDSAQNGALTAAFDYLFNYCSSSGQCTTKIEQFYTDWWPAYKLGTCIRNGDCTAGQWALGTGEAAIGIVGGIEAKATAAAGTLFRTEARNLAERLTLDEAKFGAGERIMQGKIKDPRFPEDAWAKMQHVHATPSGQNIVIHYWQRLIDGSRTGFKFKD